MEKRNFAIHFEKEHLDKLILDENSCVCLNQCTHHLALHPYHLNSTNKSLRNLLNKGIAKYDKTLGGILLGYQNMKLLSSSGAINNDTCFIHVDISADFFLFKPEVGKILTGVVNKKSEDHVGCLVHEAFNVSLPKAAKEDDWIGSYVEIGQEILFQISFIDLEGRLPYIRGFIVSIATELDSGISTGEDTKSTKKSKKKSKAKKILFDSNDEADGVETPETTKKKKKKKNRSANESSLVETSYEEPIEPEADDTEEIFAEVISTSKKKKKKHNRSREDYDIETSYEVIELPKFSETVEYHKLNKKRKREKHTDDCLDEMQYDECREVKIKHKHKKHKTEHSY